MKYGGRNLEGLVTFSLLTLNSLELWWCLGFSPSLSGAAVTLEPSSMLPATHASTVLPSLEVHPV